MNSPQKFEGQPEYGFEVDTSASNGHPQQRLLSEAAYDTPAENDSIVLDDVVHVSDVCFHTCLDALKRLLQESTGPVCANNRRISEALSHASSRSSPGIEMKALSEKHSASVPLAANELA